MLVDANVGTREHQREGIDATAGIKNQMELRGVLASGVSIRTLERCTTGLGKRVQSI